MGRPSLPPGRYFPLLLVGYFEGLDSERGIAWRAADSLAVRSFVGLCLDAAAPDHSTISRTRRLIDVENVELAINMRQYTLGLTIPPSAQLRADQILE
jgi:transposase